MDDARSKTGTLYVVATPIGNLSDMSPRAVAALKSVQVIAAEDTRHSGRLCTHFSIDTPRVPYHEHNELQQTPVLLERLHAGEDVAVVSDAGSPLLSDPGFRLVDAAHDAGIPVTPIPGPSAAITALSAAGLPCHRFHFEGFLPAKSAARRRRLQALKSHPDTLIFYESSHRLPDALEDMCTVLGGDRVATHARELTKLHESVHRGRLRGLSARLDNDPDQLKGEHVLLVTGADGSDREEGERVLEILRRELPLSQATDLAARITGAPRNRLYKSALQRKP